MLNELITHSYRDRNTIVFLSRRDSGEHVRLRLKTRFLKATTTVFWLCMYWIITNKSGNDPKTKRNITVRFTYNAVRIFNSSAEVKQFTHISTCLQTAVWMNHIRLVELIVATTRAFVMISENYYYQPVNTMRNHSTSYWEVKSSKEVWNQHYPLRYYIK